MLISYFALLAILATGCLAANTRVLHGKPATPHQFPYHVGIYKKFADEPISELRYQYGGAVISDKWVLTTAFVYFFEDNNPNVYVKAGKHVVDKEEASEQIRRVVRHVIHPEYELFSIKNPISQNDLALLKVDTPFVFNEFVSAAGISRSGDYFSSGSLAGWGAVGLHSIVPIFPKELRYNARLPVINSHDCAKAFNEIVPQIGSLSMDINNNQTCSGPDGKEWGACLQDTGSALVSQVDDEYVIIGIVASIIVPCGYFERPTVYTRVGAYSEWIHGVMKSS